MLRINAKFVRLAMAEKNYDQRTLARKSGLSEPTIYNVLKGKSFSSDTLAKLAKALECHPVDLIEADGFVDPHVDASAAAFANA